MIGSQQYYLGCPIQLCSMVSRTNKHFQSGLHPTLMNNTAKWMHRPIHVLTSFQHFYFYINSLVA